MTNTASPSQSARQFSVFVENDQSAAQALASVEPDEMLVRDAAKKGAVWVKKQKPNGQMGKLIRLRNLDAPILVGSEVLININQAVLDCQADSPTLLKEEKNYSFWFKPRGVLSQGSRWGDHTSMPYLVSDVLNRPTHLVHRLDRFACGVMVLAHTRPAVKELTALFAKHKVLKQYRVIVAGQFDLPTPHACSTPLDNATALTEIECAEYTKAAHSSTLRIRLHTGRKHQIRRHLSALDFPVLGDKRYGTESNNHDNGNVELALMATRLEFQCPFSSVAIECAVPDSLQEQLRVERSMTMNA